MASPFWTHPGTLNGRIAPVYADPQGVVSVYYYGGSYFYTYSTDYYYSGYSSDYTYEAGHVFVLGEDTNHFPEYRFLTTDTSYVSQANIDVTSVDVLYFCWNLRTSEDMPGAVRTLVSSSVCEFRDGTIMASGDGLLGIVLPAGYTDGFLETDVDRVIDVAGTAHNDGQHRISAVPWSQEDPENVGVYGVVPTPQGSQLKNGQTCLLDLLTMTPELALTATVKIYGHRWRARAYVDSTLRAELWEKPGRSWQRNYMAAHVSKLTGTHSVKFELSLEDITS